MAQSTASSDQVAAPAAPALTVDEFKKLCADTLHQLVTEDPTGLDTFEQLALDAAAGRLSPEHLQIFIKQALLKGTQTVGLRGYPKEPRLIVWPMSSWRSPS